MEPIFRQVETVKLAPDALLFINGSETIRAPMIETIIDPDTKKTIEKVVQTEFQIRNDITDLSVDLSVDSSPGTASFTLSIPDYAIRRFGSTKYNALNVMNEVEIYFKGRFQKASKKVNENDPDKYFSPYYPAFWGIITSISENYSDGTHTIQVSCADILRWWEITLVNVNPSMGSQVSNASPVTAASPYGNIFAGKEIPQILLSLSNISMNDLAPLKNFSMQRAIAADKVADSKDWLNIMLYWQKRFNQIGRGLRMYGVTLVPKYVIDPKTKKPLLDAQGKPTQRVDKLGNPIFDFGTLNPDVTKKSDSWSEQIPYTLTEGSPEVLQSGTMSKLEIVEHLKNVISFEFFMDVTGELVFKPPFYNLNVKQNTISVIEDVEIISWDFTQSESQVKTRLDVTGSFNKLLGSQVPEKMGIAYDMYLAQRFGIRAETREVTWLPAGSEKLLNYAKMELNRINALIATGTLTIIGRPELRLGYPIYIPSRDAFYYVVSINHNFSFGGTFTTSLGLTAERTKIINNEKGILKNAYFTAKGAVDDSVSTEGTTAAVTDSSNILNKVNDPCSPGKKVEAEPVIEPNFVNTKQPKSQMADGGWKLITKTEATVDEQNKINEQQITDNEGYYLIPYFNYGRKVTLDDKSQLNYETITKRRNNAVAAQKLTPLDLVQPLNPNNVGVTLDDETQMMITETDNSKEAKGQQALTSFQYA